MKYVSVCTDTLTVARSIVHGKSAGYHYKHGTLISKYLGKSYEAHNTLADVQSLQELLSSEISWKITKLAIGFQHMETVLNVGVLMNCGHY